MQVTFRKLVEQRLSTWEAVRGKRIRIPGSTMALGRGDLPHDLVQLAVEGALHMEHGFWGCVAQGATFRSLGRKRTRPGRAVIASHKHEIDAAEGIVAEHLGRWKRGEPTRAAAALDDLDRRWRRLKDGEPLVIEWPSLTVLEPESTVRS